LSFRPHTPGVLFQQARDPSDDTNPCPCGSRRPSVAPIGSRSSMTSIPPRLAANYEKLATMRSLMATMKEQQSLRGPESYAARMAERAKKNTWRQMSGMQLFMHEINHKGNFPFVVGLG